MHRQSFILTLYVSAYAISICCYSQSFIRENPREFDERKFLGKYYQTNREQKHHRDLDQNKEDVVLIHHHNNRQRHLQDPPTTGQAIDGSESRSDSASSIWFQEHPIAVPIRQSNYHLSESSNNHTSSTSASLRNNNDQSTSSHLALIGPLEANQHMLGYDQKNHSLDYNLQSMSIKQLENSNTKLNSKNQFGEAQPYSNNSTKSEKNNDTIFSSRIATSPATNPNLVQFQQFSSTPGTNSKNIIFKTAPNTSSDGDHINNDETTSSPILLLNSFNSNNSNYQQSTTKLSSIKTFENSGSDNIFASSITNQVNSNPYYDLQGRLSTSLNWWAIGSPSGISKVSKLTKENYADFCLTTSLLSTNKQRALCQIDPKIMPIIAKGLKAAIEECQHQFYSSRWNCTIMADYNDKATPTMELTTFNTTTRESIFGTVMAQQNRERSFLSAIMSAGIAHAITKACSRGELPEECNCERKTRSKPGKWEWGGCSEDIDYGVKFSREFTDSTELGVEIDHPNSMINVHNYEVGRRVLKSTVDLNCKCHGVSGSCGIRTCWKRLGSFREIGDEIIARYERATHVQLSNQPRSSSRPTKLRPVKRGARKPNKKDLVFIQESPDYCNENKRLGILGTKNRKCNSTGFGMDSCKLLCCGRGYQNIIEDIEEDCECKFVWCCEVKCQKCKQRIEYDSCN